MKTQGEINAKIRDGTVLVMTATWFKQHVKIFLDRTNCLENLYHLKKPDLTEGKVAGILV